ncbi:MAG: SUMF1/EgtB/PvdO family nonheme iron enzyme [Bryobacteraceae bacterium]
MARLILFLALLPFAGTAQDEQFKQAGVCARCHVISVVEWSMSKHRAMGVGCVECHGASQGHVVDERNNVKPDKLPREKAIATLCNSCHDKPRNRQDCQSCHHAHALVDPNKPAKVADVVAATPAPARRLPDVRGLPRKITVAGIDLVLVEGGEFDMGTERWPNAKPVHTVRVNPYYIGIAEVSAVQWRAVMGAGAGAGNNGTGAASNVSWFDCQEFIKRLNAGAPGGGLRLPTEAEWEFAAHRAGTLGLAQMLGSVWEWTGSDYRPYFDQNAEPARLKVLRGGSDADTPDLRDVAFRHGERPDRRLRCNGLRLAKEIQLR